MNRSVQVEDLRGKTAAFGTTHTCHAKQNCACTFRLPPCSFTVHIFPSRVENAPRASIKKTLHCMITLPIAKTTGKSGILRNAKQQNPTPIAHHPSLKRIRNHKHHQRHAKIAVAPIQTPSRLLLHPDVSTVYINRVPIPFLYSRGKAPLTRSLRPGRPP